MTNKYMYFIANWKMFGTLNSLNLLNKVIKFFNKFNKNKSVKIIYCPPTTLLDQMNKKLRNTKIEIGAQNCHQEEKYGAYTGSISALMLKNAGAKYVIIGHSENRKSGENDELINAKIRVALKAKLKVIFCIGESLKQKRKKITKKVLNKQLKFGLNKIKYNKNILIAYEPVWSIGTGLVPKNNDLKIKINVIKKIVSKLWRLNNPKIVYGGSVNTKNISELRKISSIKGFLVGGASQKAKNFIDIIKKTIN